MTSEGRLDLPPSLTEETFVKAVEGSGYPLQIVVGAALSERAFELEEEWAFEDPDSELRRTLDIVARQRHSSGPIVSEQGTTELSVALLIECKQSRDPYVFFESVTPPALGGFPFALGLGNGFVRVTAAEGKDQVDRVPLMRVIGDGGYSILGQPPIAASLSRATLNGKKVKLSGDEPFKSLLLPLTKALGRYGRQWQGGRGDGYNPKSSFDVRVPFALAVVDAPMIFVGRPSDSPSFNNAEWVRLIVRHPVRWIEHSAGIMQRGGDFSVVDVVRRPYFDEFLDEHLRPFADHFYARFTELADGILAGEIQAADIHDPSTG